MPKGKDLDGILKPLPEAPIQAYFGSGVHTLGILHWILKQTGKADVWVSSYSTSEPFLNGFCLMKMKGIIGNSAILLDQRAARKTLKLERLMVGAFDHVFMGQNHSKILLIRNRSFEISVITSQNQTYGARAESTVITTNHDVFEVLLEQFIDIVGENAVELDIAHGKGIITKNRGAGQVADDTCTDWKPFGYEP
ncbi:MAG: C4-dicarboxylate ABC transporter [Prevotella sp.]|jgi:hypothetical protein|nr:C4-dicarboxylate ABC transporter [Prevotella sp.]MCH3994138.1 C4-dicarboxylate ABC transporter [Prevotella sp.]